MSTGITPQYPQYYLPSADLMCLHHGSGSQDGPTVLRIKRHGRSQVLKSRLKFKLTSDGVFFTLISDGGGGGLAWVRDCPRSLCLGGRG